MDSVNEGAKSVEIILSTCGTSILTNDAGGELKPALTNYANAGQPGDVPEAERRMMTGHIRRREDEFADLPVRDARERSAELNGILAYYENQPAKGKGDRHYLLATDTWLGRATAEIVAIWLKKSGMGDVVVYSHKDLQTADFPIFRSSLSDLVKWCSETLESRRSGRVRVVFNLSGGFKAETGFLQLLGMFYADEIVYIFERSGKLLRIPRLPVVMEDESAVRKDLRDFRRANLGLSVKNRKDGIYWLDCDGCYGFTPWGELVFEKHRKNLYGEEVLDSPSDLVRFDGKFPESCTERFADINEKIDLLAKYAESEAKNKRLFNPKKLDYKPLKGGGHPRIPGATHECDAWHDGAAKRIFCREEGNTVVLMRLGDALHD